MLLPEPFQLQNRLGPWNELEKKHFEQIHVGAFDEHFHPEPAISPFLLDASKYRKKGIRLEYLHEQMTNFDYLHLRARKLHPELNHHPY